MLSCWNGSDKLTVDQCMHVPGMHLAQFACVVPRGVGRPQSSVALPSIQKESATPADIFDVAKSWLADTGCPIDLAPTPCNESHPESVYPSTSHTFETAAGDAESEAKIRLVSGILEGQATACLLDAAPPVLTVGGGNSDTRMSG